MARFVRKKDNDKYFERIPKKIEDKKCKKKKSLKSWVGYVQDGKRNSAKIN